MGLGAEVAAGQLRRAARGVEVPDRGERQGVARRRARQVLLDQAEVAVVPGEAFGTPGYFRLSYALGDADLEEGVSRIGKLLAQAR